MVTSLTADIVIPSDLIPPTMDELEEMELKLTQTQPWSDVDLNFNVMGNRD